MPDESRKSAIRKVMRMKSWNYKTAAAFVDDQLKQIQKQIDRFESTKRLLNHNAGR